MTIKSCTPQFSIIIPVYNGGDQFIRCVAAIQHSDFTDWELIVVDDGSTDQSRQVAIAAGATVLQTKGRQGPAAARNIGGRAAKGDYLYFIDADCVMHQYTLSNIAQLFQTNPWLEALFGSYDDAPAAPNFVAQYKNLFHHYVHQHSSPEAATFWTGCGAIKRQRFLELGGFDVQRYQRPAIEDIELGYRLKLAGGQIRLAPHVQVKHLKAWTLKSLLKTDIVDRGIPWTHLLLKNKAFQSDLNLQTHNRISVMAVYSLLFSLATTLIEPQALWLVLALFILLIWLNWPLYYFFYQKRGAWFAVRTLPLHWLYYFYNAISFACGLWLYWREQFKPETLKPPPPLIDQIETDTNG